MSTEAQVNPKDAYGDGAASIIPDLLAAEARIADLRRQLADAERRVTEALEHLATLQIAVHTLGVQPAGTEDSDKAWAYLCGVAQNLPAATRGRQAQLAAQAETLRRMREALLAVERERSVFCDPPLHCLVCGARKHQPDCLVVAALADTASQDTPAPAQEG